MQAKYQETKGLKSWRERSERPRKEALVVMPGLGRVREVETQRGPRLLAQEMVIMEADTQPDPVPSTLRVFFFYRHYILEF